MPQKLPRHPSKEIGHAMAVCMADSSLNSLRMVCLNERKRPLHDLGMVTWFVWIIVTLLLISRRWFVWIIVTLPLHNLDMACLHYCAVYPFKNWTWFVWIIVTSSLKHLDVVRLNSCDIIPQPWFFWIIVNLSPNAWKMACLSCGDVIPQSFGHGFSGLLSLIVTLSLHNWDADCLNCCDGHPWIIPRRFAWIIVTWSLCNCEMVCLSELLWRCLSINPTWSVWIIVKWPLNNLDVVCLNCWDPSIIGR